MISKISSIDILGMLGMYQNYDKADVVRVFVSRETCPMDDGSSGHRQDAFVPVPHAGAVSFGLVFSHKKKLNWIRLSANLLVQN